MSLAHPTPPTVVEAVVGSDEQTASYVAPESSRRLRDAGELLERERNARQQLDAEKTVRERLLAIVTREIVTQANVASGWLNLMRREHLDAGLREKAFAKIDAALSTQLRLLDELVGISPVAVGHVNVDCRRVDVAAAARAVAADVGDDRAHVIANGAATVVADAEHVIRALRALVRATTRETDSVTVNVDVAGESVRVRFSNAVRNDDDALGVARRVAALYRGTIEVAADETSFVLPGSGQT
jgi:hypothetical protein